MSPIAPENRYSSGMLRRCGGSLLRLHEDGKWEAEVVRRLLLGGGLPRPRWFADDVTEKRRRYESNYMRENVSPVVPRKSRRPNVSFAGTVTRSIGQ